jgi:hypothetical protein
MHGMTKGSRVVAMRTLWRWGPGLGVPKGTHGLVQDVDFSGTMTVDFGNGQVFRARYRDVRQQRDGDVGSELSPGRREAGNYPEIAWAGSRLAEHTREAASGGDAMWAFFAWLAMVFLVALSLVLITDGVAYLAGYGQQRTIHIEATHTGIITVEQAEPGSDGTIEYIPKVETITIGDGYYLDNSGSRHSISLRGDDLKAGMVVHARHPLLASGPVPELRSGWDGPGLIVTGILCAMCVAFGVAEGSSSSSDAQLVTGALGIAQAFFVLWMLH